MGELPGRASPKAVTDAGLHLNGWSARGGFTRNPYDLGADPCGSSSGSAVAPAANLCAVAIGTETDGSIVCPSAQQRDRRAQADGRTRLAGRHHPDLAQPGHGRADEPVRDRRGDRAQRAPLAVRRGRRPAPAARLPGGPPTGRLARRTDRRRSAAFLRRRRGRGPEPRRGARVRDDGRARCDARRPHRVGRHGLDRGRRDDGPAHRMQGRDGRLPAAARRDAACGRWPTSSPSTTTTARTSSASSARSCSRSPTRRPVSTIRPISRPGRAASPRPARTASTGSSPDDRLDAIVAPGVRRLERTRRVRLPGRSRSRPA